MSAPAVPNPAPEDIDRERQRERTALEELAASTSDIAADIGRLIDSLMRAYATSSEPMTPAQAAERARAPYPAERDPMEFGPEQLDWRTLANLLEHEPERGQAAWQRAKALARHELRTGVRAAKANERTFATPYERAQYLAILEALGESLSPRGGAEHLLVQQMATALEQQLRWQTIATRRVDEESWHGERDVRRTLERMSPRERERHEEVEGWLPPRQSDAEAIEQAVMMADRYGRQFLRLLRAFRDMRRTIGAVIMTGGQLNVAEQIRQVNVGCGVDESGPGVTD